MNRRNFIERTGLGIAGATAHPSLLLTKSEVDQLNLGIIGCGSRGNGLISIIKNIPGLRIVALSDILPFRLERAISNTKKAKGYPDYLSLLDNKNIDAVIIATPFSTHGTIAIDALKAGKHVYCEKTMAKGYSEIRELYKVALDTDKIFQTGHQYHSSRLYSQIVSLVQNGIIGQVNTIDCQWNRNGSWRRKVTSEKMERIINWRMYKEFSGGLLAELSSHQIDFSNWLLKSVPTQVVAVGGIDYWQDGRETFDNIHCIYSYKNGVKAKFTCLTMNGKDDYLIKVHGDKGTITIDYDKAWLHHENKAKEIGIVDGVSGATISWDKEKGGAIDVKHLDPSKQALLDFKKSIINGTEPESNILTGANTAIAVQMGLDALNSNSCVFWNDDLLKIL